MALVDRYTRYGFTAIVRITEYTISNSAYDDLSRHTFASMTMEGKLLVFEYKHLKNGFDARKTKIAVEIEFMEESEIDRAAHIGYLRLYENTYDGYDVEARISLVLGNNMFLHLGGMQEKGIRFEAVNHLFDEPKNIGHEWEVLGLVRRVDFTIEFPMTNKDKWPFILERKKLY